MRYNAKIALKTEPLFNAKVGAWWVTEFTRFVIKYFLPKEHVLPERKMNVVTISVYVRTKVVVIQNVTSTLIVPRAPVETVF